MKYQYHQLTYKKLTKKIKNFYESCIGYFKRKIQTWDQFSVIGLMIGAWVTIHQFYEQFRHQQFGVDSIQFIDNIV